MLEVEDIPSCNFVKNIDYKKVRSFKLPLLEKAALNFDIKNRDFLKFEKTNEYWLSDYALFMSIKEIYKCESILSLEDGLKYRLPISIECFKEKHFDRIMFYKITQYLFYSQYFRLKNYASKNGIKIIGDIPFYISLESADVWSNPDIFRLGLDMTPVLVYGVPLCSEFNQWQISDNPVYDWVFQKKTNFYWWRKD